MLGKDLWEAWGPSTDRTTPVADAMLGAMNAGRCMWVVYLRLLSANLLVPLYTCPSANVVHATFQKVPS